MPFLLSVDLVSGQRRATKPPRSGIAPCRGTSRQTAPAAAREGAHQVRQGGSGVASTECLASRHRSGRLPCRRSRDLLT